MRAVRLIIVTLATMLGAPMVVPSPTYAYDAVEQASPDDCDVAPLTRVDIRLVELVASHSNVLRYGPEGSASHLTEARGPSSTPSVAFVATNTAASAGSTGRTVAGNLTEQLAMKEVVSSPAGTQIANIVMKDARWPAADGWVKMTQRVNGIEVHYVRNTITGAVDDFKFPLPTPGGG